MSEPFIAEIRIFAGNFAPRSWAFCDGQLLPIAQNNALFSLIGTTYGGDGRTTTALPDLQGRAPMHPGRGPGLTDRRLGQKVGVEHVSLTEAQIPSHNHAAHPVMEGKDGEMFAPGANTTLAKNGDVKTFADPKSLVSFSPKATTAIGGNQPHNNIQPYLALNFIIALQGLFPSRS